MRWRDVVTTPEGGGPWQGLAISVDKSERPAGPPGLCVRARAGRIRIDVGPSPRVWASLHRWRYGLWTLVAGDASPGVLPPIRSREIRAVAAPPFSEEWWRLWARDFAARLAASPRSPLHEGRFTLSPARSAEGLHVALPGPSLFSGRFLSQIERVEGCLDEPAVAWESWWTSGSGAALRLRAPSDPDASRIKALRKLARDGVTPPLLFYFVSGLDMFVLLDGHDRLRALTLERAPIPLFVLTHVQSYSREPSPGQQAGILREIDRRSVPGASRRGPLPVRVANALLIDAFDDRPWLFPRTRAFDLRGGAALWADEVTRVFRLPPGHPAFAGEPPPEGPASR